MTADNQDCCPRYNHVAAHGPTRVCLFVAIILLCLALTTNDVSAQSGSISIAKVSTLTSAGPAVYCGAPVRLVLQFSNTTPYKVDCSNGWRVSSPDGAVWTSVTLDTVGPYVSGRSVLGGYFDIVFYVRQTSADPGPPADTVGWLGVGTPINSMRQLPVGFNDTTLALTINFAADQKLQNNGKHICVDSSFWGTGGDWKWVTVAGTSAVEFTPEFHGYFGQSYVNGSGYCFQLTGEEPCTPYITIHGGTAGAPSIPWSDVTLTGSHCSSFAFDFDCFDCDTFGVTFTQTAGPGQLDTLTGIWTYQPSGQGDVGSTAVTVACRDAGGQQTSPPRTIGVVVTNVGPVITSNCSAVTGEKGVETSFQITADPQDCDRTRWTAKIISGDTTGLCTIDSTGTVHFIPASVGSHLIRVVASDSLVADTCQVSAWVVLPATCCQGTTGNVDQAGIIDVSDLSLLVAYLTTGTIPLFCVQAANINTTGIIDISDLSLLIAYLTVPGVTLPNCPSGVQAQPKTDSTTRVR